MTKHPVIITGGAQRLGLAAARALHNKGYEVVITYRTKRQSLTQLQDMGITCIQADFSDDQGIENFIHDIKNRYSQIRAIIHNASSWLPDDTSGDLNTASQVFNTMMQVHVKTPYLINEALSNMLLDQADIIHLSDLVATTGSAKHMAYAASKAALENLTLSLARKLAPTIQVNTISPALILFNEQDDEAYRAKTLKKSLLGIEPGAKTVTDSIVYLLENNYITGRTLSLDGGRHLNLP